MTGIQKHLLLFPPRLRRGLFSFSDWDGVAEIRLRENRPLSLTHFKGNVMIDETGAPTGPEKALCAGPGEIRHLVGAFCKGCVYRYFDRIDEGYIVDEDGFRLGLCPPSQTPLHFLPNSFQGANLRIPHFIPGAADDVLSYFSSSPIASTLVISPPGEGKTTLLRALATRLSTGFDKVSPRRVVVVDERRELFPAGIPAPGLLDVLSGYRKCQGIEIATRLFSPQAIFCDEIGSVEEANALLSLANTGCHIFASAHAGDPEQARRRPHLEMLFSAGVFSYVAQIQFIPGERYQNRIRMVKV